MTKEMVINPELLNEIYQSQNPVLEGVLWIMQQPRFSEHAWILQNSTVDPNDVMRNFDLPNWKFFIPDMDIEPALALMFIGNSINAAYTNFETGIQYSRGNKLGAEAMWDALLNGYKNMDFGINGSDLQNLDLDKMNRIFDGNNPLPKLAERLENLQQLGSVIKNNYNNQFINLLEASSGKIFGEGGLVTRLTNEFQAYHDYYDISVNENTKRIFINKRAQLVAGMIAGWTQNSKFTFFEINQLSQLTVYADYILPMVNLNLGRIGFSQSLLDAVYGKVVLKSDDDRVIAFRSATILRCFLDVMMINDIRRSQNLPPIIQAGYDAYLWLNNHGQVGFTHPLVDTLRM